MSDGFKLRYEPKLTVCSCCGIAKAPSEFYTQSTTGLPTAQCKTCINVKRSVVRGKRRHNKFVSKEKFRTGEVPEFTLVDWKACMVHFSGCCAYCGKPEGRAAADKVDRDHAIPISKGGKTTKRNVIPACRACNRGRGNADWQVWFSKQNFYTVERERHIQAWLDGKD